MSTEHTRNQGCGSDAGIAGVLRADRTHICSSMGKTDVTNLELLTAAITSIWFSCLVRSRTILRAREMGRCTRAFDSDRALGRKGGWFNAL